MTSQPTATLEQLLKRCREFKLEHRAHTKAYDGFNSLEFLILSLSSENKATEISAGGAHDLRLFCTPGISGTADGLIVAIDANVPPGTIIIRDELGRELGRIINVS